MLELTDKNPKNLAYLDIASVTAIQVWLLNIKIMVVITKNTYWVRYMSSSVQRVTNTIHYLIESL